MKVHRRFIIQRGHEHTRTGFTPAGEQLDPGGRQVQALEKGVFGVVCFIFSEPPGSHPNVCCIAHSAQCPRVHAL